MRRTGLIAMLTVGIALIAVGLAAAQPGSGIVRPTSEPATPGEQLGAQLYAGNCASCHGIAGSGIKSPRPGAGDILGAGPPLRGVGAMAADFYLRTGYMPLSSIHDQPGPDRVLFSDKEIRSLVAYVASLRAGPGVPHPQPESGNLAEGLHQFTMHCAGCHQVVARGGYATGALVPPLQSATPTEIAEAVRIGPYLMPRFPTSQISDAELNSIIKYVVSTRHPDNRGGWGIGNLGPIPEGLVTWWIAVPLLLIACMAVGRRLRG
ncbi:MAG TPA: c-type cytochrome [Solirubrobacteraceae bacterium]|nr:c-type cytochrome [Solirubrobacteraceae bacterium]